MGELCEIKQNMKKLSMKNFDGNEFLLYICLGKSSSVSPYSPHSRVCGRSVYFALQGACA